MAEDTTGQTPARDEMIAAGAEAILRYMGEWGTDDDSTEAKAHELGQWVLDAALAGRTVVELREPDGVDSDAAWWEYPGGQVVVHSVGRHDPDKSVRFRAMAAALLAGATYADRQAAESGQDTARACCDLHNAHCEPPSELCCHGCTEAQHPQHPPGVRCVLESGQDGDSDG